MDLLAELLAELPPAPTPAPVEKRPRGRPAGAMSERNWYAARVVAGGLGAGMSYEGATALAGEEFCVSDGTAGRAYAACSGEGDFSIPPEPRETIERLRKKHCV